MSFNLPDGNFDLPDVEEAKAQEKINRFMRMDSYEQINYWKANSDEYAEILHEYIMDNQNMPISWEEVAELLYLNTIRADETILDYWEEE